MRLTLVVATRSYHMTIQTAKFNGKALSETAYQCCLELLIRFLKQHESIRNRDIRDISGITYDQAIYFFNRAVAERWVDRKGVGGSTCYVLSKEQGGESGKNI
jgi:hypothetical protein